MSTEISELFDRDPLNLSDQNIDIIVEHMRKANTQFELGVKSPKATKPKSTKTSNLLDQLGLSAADDLKDLGL
jgi:hypothetical protein